MDQEVISNKTTQTDTRWAHYESDRLCDLERWIGENVQEIARCRLSICLALARIKTGRLYNQADCCSFSDYLKAKRVAIHYNTALDYACIGEVYLKYHRELEACQFDEYSGLRKLLLLERALQFVAEDRDEIFKKLKKNSYREFKRFIVGSPQPGRPGCVSPDGRHLSSSKIVLTDECLVVMPAGKEILWFDPELDAFLESPELMRRFKHCISRAVAHFFHEE